MLVYLFPKSPFPDLHSDTIFGAILYAMDQLGTDVSELLNKFGESPSFLVSSAFPFAIHDDTKTRFFPKPIVMPHRVDMDSTKRFKKVMYVEEGIFNRWVDGEINEGKIIEDLEKGQYIIGAEKFLVRRDSEVNFEKFKVESINLPRNTINRVTQASENIFYTSLHNFSEDGGLFFAIRFLDTIYKNDVIAALKFLRDRGFGGDVSVGKGQFDFKIEDKDIQNQDGERFVILSRYIPGEELKLFNMEEMWYEIGSKRGRGSDGRVRRQVRFFIEGSTFPEIRREFYGRIIHSAGDAVEYGYSYKVGMKGNG